MHISAFFTIAFLLPFTLAAPTGVRAALEPRQTNSAGSTSTSTTNNGLLGLTSGSAAAAEDGQSTSSTSTSDCNLINCTSGASSAGPSGSSSSTSSSNFGGLGSTASGSGT